ncbi:uncharacterized protein LOC128740186 [Sabethes cyaneus]|uniref:uncharacterized protein LOC128740186 n=1 Tax=Sabethes cyaneus TaxID=53552 RepID=UPI00237DC048|nr:uncharacterized protein LOC128740186 [Sabethes cyaneus]
MKPIFGVYQQGGRLYYLKYYLMLCLLYIRKLQQKLTKQSDNLKDEGLDKPQLLSDNVHAVDAVYFNGTQSDLSWIVCGTARRRNNLVNGFLYLKVAGFSDKLLVSPRLPDTCMYQTEDEFGQYQVEGLKLYPLEPMKSWKLEYTGKMRFENDHSQLLDVNLEAKWTTNFSYFNFASDMDATSIARATAKELWSREHFKNLKKYHQTHYEHYGFLTGSVHINGAKYELSLDCMRDHSFGEQRNWKHFHRYVMHFIHLENGDRITVGAICMPNTFSSLEVGFLSFPNNKGNLAISNVYMNLYHYGEQGCPPVDYAFQFAADKRVYTVKVKAVIGPEFYIGTESECRIVEQLCIFDVNGIKGWGAAEWQYRNNSRILN